MILTVGTAEKKLKSSIKTIKGIGDARAALFQRLGVYTVEDMISYFPRDYEDRNSFRRICELEDGEKHAFEGVVLSKVVESRPRKGLLISRTSIRDETGVIQAVWFNQPYIKNVFEAGKRYVFYGKVTRKRSFEIQNPVYERLGDDEMKNTCRIIPVYPSTESLSQNVIRAAIRACLSSASDMVAEYLPESIRNKLDLRDIQFALKNIHFPGSDEAFEKARTRLVFEELLMLQLRLLRLKGEIGKPGTGNKFGASEAVREFEKTLPFALTGAQKKVLAEIERDMESSTVMNRLVQGDVGSGKTIVAVLALFKAVKSGFQGAFMVPTEILAEQHFISLRALLDRFRIRVALLTGSLTKKQKEELLEEIREGRIDIVVGTHALIEENVRFSRLGLVVTDEQHRFGVRQRAVLAAKGINPDMLVMTATPIPRTLALIIYGDLDISVIDELPPGRKPVETYSVNGSMRERINSFIRKKAGEGRQVYIVCPLVEESEAVEAKAATELAHQMAEKDFKGLTVALIHGKMKPKDKDAVMKSFVRGETAILVSTTVIEVGVNVPNATVMVVENAERFGLAQLHQLRGRVGRGSEQSYCILFNESKNEIAGQRMKIMEKTNDGFVISEKDLELRGPGEFFGTRQHGIPDLKIANLYRDMDILKQAQKTAIELLAEDRDLEKEENRLLGQKLKEASENGFTGLN